MFFIFSSVFIIGYDLSNSTPEQSNNIFSFVVSLNDGRENYVKMLILDLCKIRVHSSVFVGAEQSRAEQGRAEQSRAGQSRAEQSRAGHSRAEQSRAEQSRAEQSRAGQSRAGQSRAEQSRAERSCFVFIRF